MKYCMVAFEIKFSKTGIIYYVYKNCSESRAYLRGGGVQTPHPPKFSDFFLKSEGKEIERKRKKGCWGGGGVTS